MTPIGSTTAVVIQAVRGERPLPRAKEFVPLGLFLLCILSVTALGLLINPVPLRGQTYAGRAARALATLVIGLVFFVSAAWMNRRKARRAWTVRIWRRFPALKLRDFVRRKSALFFSSIILCPT